MPDCLHNNGIQNKFPQKSKKWNVIRNGSEKEVNLPQEAQFEHSVWACSKKRICEQIRKRERLCGPTKTCDYIENEGLYK